MRNFRRFRTPLTAALLALAISGAAYGQNRYGEDLVRRLASPAEIRETVNLSSKQLRKESKSAEPLLVLTPPPFSDIEAAPPSNTEVSSARPKQWEMPPWPTVDPAIPEDAPESLRQEMAARVKQLEPSTIWSDVPVAGQDANTPSVFIRPRPVAPGEEFVFRNKEIPAPFSLRHYHDGNENIFVQIAAYGGTTSYKAEEAYRAMKEAATKQDPLEGVGKEAFMTRVVITDAEPSASEEPFVDGPPIPEAPPFADIAPDDRARPDLTDSGRAAALTAPAFIDIAVADLEGKRVNFEKGPKKYVPKGGNIKQTVTVIVAFFPDQAVTLSFAIEERLGDIQDLIPLAMLAQRKLKEDIVARD